MCEILRQKVGRHIQTSIWRNKQTQKNITFQHKGWDRKGGCGNLVKNKIKKNKTKIKTQAGLQPNNWKVNYAVQWREQMEKKNATDTRYLWKSKWTHHHGHGMIQLRAGSTKRSTGLRCACYSCDWPSCPLACGVMKGARRDETA